MPSNFFRVERGFEISRADGEPLIQILTGTAAPDVQADAIAAPIGSLWIVNGGGLNSTRTYQKTAGTFSDRRDWRDVSQSISWRDPAEARDNTAVTLPTETPNDPITVDGQTITDGERVLFSNLTETAATDTLQSDTANAGGDNAITTADTYFFTVATNGGAPIEYSVVIAGATTFDALATLMTTAWGLGTVTWDDANDQFLFTTTLVGSSASVEAFELTASTPALFATVEAEATGGPIDLTEELGIAGIGPDIYVYDQPTGTFFRDPAQAATDGDAVLIQAGTFADLSYLYNGTTWVEFGSGTAAEEGFIRDFIGKDAAGAETPDYAAPTDGGADDEAPNNTPFTDATSANGYVVNDTDNLELAIAKLNQEVFQNNRHVYATGVTTLVDAAPVNVDGVKWMARVQQGTQVRAAEIHATTNGTVVDYSVASILSIGAAITGLSVTVALNTGQLEITVSTTAASTFEIRRLGTVGVPATVGRALHV